MKRSTTSSTIAGWLVMAVLTLVPFHAFLTVWFSQLVGHYTLLRLWPDVLLLIVVGIAVSWLVRERAIREWFFGSLLVRLIAAYAGLTLLLGLVALAKGDVTLKAGSYGILVNLRFLVWFLTVILTTRHVPRLRIWWPKIVLIPAAIVVMFASLQYTVLPHNFLVHFGYNVHTTIAPIETINHNAHYIRVQSTLRGANPLGAYLVLILSVLGALFAGGKRRLICGIFGLAALFALFASGSRSAWIGAFISLALIAWLRLPTRRARIVLSSALVGLTVIASGIFVVVDHHAGVQNAVLHTQDNSTSKVSSNAAHASALKRGLSDVWQQPFGGGPGTAGPASVYNGARSPRIAENYFIQIAQEVGWLGLALFVSILALVGIELYQAAATSRLALALFASLIGLSLVNLVSHAWVDETLAFLWWGLAGIALGKPLKATKNHED